ncbi:GDP-mannose 4,6-dehydratase [Candidatus Magnetoovum chiemensis]|nr:GDP-mannose 4,6-dehydratase [Candidatus Magnetoovum chiemensis]
MLYKGYEVHGLIRRSSSFNTDRIDHLYVDPHQPEALLFLHYGDLSDSGHLTNLVYNIKPQEIYNLAAQSHVRVSFDLPAYTADITALGTTRLLEALRRSGIKAKFYQASSSEMFGSSQAPQNEDTPFCPRSPYAVAKVYSYWMTVNYREGYNLFTCNGILFNHESPRRGETFVTRKITCAIANMISGKQKKLYLGNLDAKRDWGFAPEYVECQWLMLQSSEPGDYVIGTGQAHSVREFAELAFTYSGIEIEWQGAGVEEKGIVRSCSRDIDLKPGEVIIEIDARYFRPTEVDFLLADASKAKNILYWQPVISFDSLVKIMVDYDFKNKSLESPNEGRRALVEAGFSWLKENGE